MKKNNMLISEVHRIKEMMGINENKILLKEGIGDELAGLLTKFFSKSFDEIAALGVRNADELITLMKNFPTANTLDQAKILRTIIAGLGDNAVKSIAKGAVDDVTTGIGKVMNDRTTQYLEWYKKGVMTYDEVVSQISDDVGSIMAKSSDELQSLKTSIDNEIKIKARKSLDDINPGLKNVSNGSGPQSYLDNLSKTELETRLGSYSWKNIGYNQDLMSGWKFHVFGEDLKDAVYLQDALKPVIDKYRCSAKIGGTYQNSADSFKPGQVQHGKQGATIYIPPNVINSGNQKEMLSDIQNAISGYKKGGTISGDQAITPSIHYRYELTGPVPKGGIDMGTYDKMYSRNDGGSYKPSDVDDLFETSTTGTIKSVPKIENGFLATKFGDTSNVNWEVIANAKNMSDYDVFIDEAFKTGDFSKISRSGFEDYGIPNFREYLMNIYNKQVKY
jgi:hypothetical protein